MARYWTVAKPAVAQVTAGGDVFPAAVTIKTCPREDQGLWPQS